MRTRALVAGGTAALALVPSAQATIVPQRGMAGVRLGMTQPAVRSVLGRPHRVHRGSNDFGPFTEYRYTGLVVSFQGNTGVTALLTTSRRERTRTGVGVGSTESQIRSGVPGVRCRTEFGRRHCWLGRFMPGRRVTDFSLRRGRVLNVAVGTVLD